MRLSFHIYHHRADDGLMAALARIERSIAAMAVDFTRITNEVSEMGDAVEGAVTLLADLSEKIRACGVDPAKLEELADALDASGTKLAEAVAANTPADPELPPGDEEE